MAHATPPQAKRAILLLWSVLLCPRHAPSWRQVRRTGGRTGPKLTARISAQRWCLAGPRWRGKKRWSGVFHCVGGSLPERPLPLPAHLPTLGLVANAGGDTMARAKPRSTRDGTEQKLCGIMRRIQPNRRGTMSQNVDHVLRPHQWHFSKLTLLPGLHPAGVLLNSNLAVPITIRCRWTH